MDELEDILDDEEDNSEDERQAPANRAFAEQRNAIKKLERELKKAQSRIEQLTPYEEQVKMQGVKEAFSKVGLSEKHAVLFRKTVGEVEITEDAVRSFAEEYELPIKNAEPPQETEVEQPPAPVFPPPVQGAGPGAPEGIFTPEQAAELFASDPERYARMRQSGQLKLPKLSDHRFYGQQPK